ncbi:MAG TPA: ribulose-bisphosphate carboxylase large subunit family protein [Blastocatellia bacterium]|nr:ribulose-bisphosphate carboxylase large subunit family protein [Blastocatellia bacterium]
MTLDRIIATYRIETAHPLARAAEVMAGEQSCGTFIRVPGETDELREQHAARVECITEMESVDVPSLPFSKPPKNHDGKFKRAEVVLSFPLANMGASLPNLLATVCGNLYELQEFSGLKLIDLELPRAFADKYPGPQFGIAGTRKLTGVADRPVIGTIIKPSVGLSPQQTADLVRTLIEAGLDFIKDDELMANPPHSPFSERFAAVSRVINDYAERTGKKPMYAVNITDEMDEMLRHHDEVLAGGGTCVMVSLNHVGVPAVAHLRRHSQLPIHGHRNGWGMLTREAYLGIEYPAYQKIWRLAGVDHMHCNGLRNKFWEPDESVIRSAQALLTPLYEDKPYLAMPVIASAQWAGQAVDTYEQVGSADLMYVCGGGIVAHPDGIAAGVLSVRQAWEAALQGVALEEYAITHAELQRALEKFGQS